MARRRNGFTALRLCAALSVLFTHSFVLVGRGEADPLARVARYLSFSSFGVDLFFAISGYLICGSILRGPSPRRYILNRGIPNLPCSDCCHHSHRISSRPDHDDRRGYWHRAATYDYLLGALLYPWQGHLPGVFTNNPVSIVNGSLWTLPLEFTCYLLLLAASWSKALGHRSLGLAVIIGLDSTSKRLFMAGQSIFGMSFLHLNCLGVIFSVGALLASLKDKVVYSPAAAVTAVAIILAAWGLGQSDWHRFAVAYLVLMPYVVVTLAWRLQRFHWLDRWDISYGFYLYAFVVQQIVVVEFGPGSQ